MTKEGLRRRKGEAKAEHKGSEKKPKTAGEGLCMRLSQISLLSTLALVSYLFYAYASSPTSSVIIRDSHDASSLKWAQTKNNDLQNGEKLLKELHGPESVVADKDGNWYTGVVDGRLLKIIDGGTEKQSVFDVTERADFSRGSKRIKKRPLGLRLVGNSLYLADSYQGLFVIDIESNKWEKIVGYDDVTPPMMFTNDLTITKDEKTVYFTDATARWQYHHVSYSILEGECSGRVFKVDVASKQVETIQHGLCFANGIQLNPEETMLLLSESSRRRIAVLDLDSRKIVKKVLFPGSTDNIRPCRAGGYWVPVPALHHTDIKLVNENPFLRDIAATVLGHDGLSKLAKLNQGIAVKLNEEFEPVSIHYDLEGKIAHAVTQVQELDNGQFLLGSFIAHGIAKLDHIGTL